MHDIPSRVSEELLPWVQVTPYHSLLSEFTQVPPT